MKSVSVGTAQITLLAAAIVSSVLTAAIPTAAVTRSQDLLPLDDFESGLSRWDVSNEDAIAIIDSGDATHGKVLQLTPAEAQIRALIRGSSDWAGYRIEGEVLFPENRHNYLGLVYHYSEHDGRVDLGSIYIKGNGSYIRVNPRRDWNPHRMLYEEMRVALTGDDAIHIGQWQRFAAEVVGNSCHFYVGDMETPKVTFDFYEGDRGAAGFKPRVVGGATWIDNIRVQAIEELSYRGEARPAGVEYDPDSLITDWAVMGPLTRAIHEIESSASPQEVLAVDGGAERRWRRFETDPRGAVITGRVTEFLGSRTIGYFATSVQVGADEHTELQFSSIDDLTLWIDGRFRGYAYRDSLAWYDFGRNPDHPPTVSIPLEPGNHEVLVRVRGGVYASGGFFARVVRR
jgi:hypothetical protein